MDQTSAKMMPEMSPSTTHISNKYVVLWFGLTAMTMLTTAYYLTVVRFTRTPNLFHLLRHVSM